METAGIAKRRLGVCCRDRRRICTGLQVDHRAAEPACRVGVIHLPPRCPQCKADEPNTVTDSAGDAYQCHACGHVWAPITAEIREHTYGITTTWRGPSEASPIDPE